MYRTIGMSWYYQSKLDAVIRYLKDSGEVKLAQALQQPQQIKQQVETGSPANLCDAPANLCPFSKGIERSLMPQFDGQAGWMFLKELGQKGVKVNHDVVPVGSLKASQNDISAVAVHRALGNLKKPTNEEQFVQGHPIFSSGDMFVLDGHHRWAALLVYSIITRGDNQEPAPIIKIEMPFDQLITVANASKEVAHSTFESAAQPKNFTPETTQQTALPQEVPSQPSSPQV